MDLLAIFGVHTIKVERYLGSGARGDVYAPPETVEGVWVVERTVLVRNQHGDEVTSTAQIGAPVTLDAPVGSLVALPSGRTTTVLQASRGIAPGLPLPEFQAISCE